MLILYFEVLSNVKISLVCPGPLRESLIRSTGKSSLIVMWPGLPSSTL